VQQQSTTPSTNSSNEQRLTRQKRKLHDLEEQSDEIERQLVKDFCNRTKIRNISKVVVGQYELDCWYYSPYPYALQNHVDRLFVCDKCLKYTLDERLLHKHSQNCTYIHPPGNEIYRDSDANLSLFEVDGDLHKLWCQNLCLLAKLFIDHKTAFFDVEFFLFYVLTICDLNKHSYSVVGYFSKEKLSAENNNVACILTFPQYQRMGYGRFLIDVSYELSRIEQRVGSPEKPLSDLGKLSYRSYWMFVLIQKIVSAYRSGTELSIHDLSQMTFVKQSDIISTLKYLNLCQYIKGQHTVYIPKKEVLDEHEMWYQKELIKLSKYTRFQNAKLKWTPSVYPKMWKRSQDTRNRNRKTDENEQLDDKQIKKNRTYAR